MTTSHASYGWIITTDHLAEKNAGELAGLGAEVSDVGTVGPHNISDENRARLLAGEGIQFRLSDSDRELYYTGLYVGPGEDGSGDQAQFGPLDDYGRPGAGCTTIEYLGHEWREL